MHFKIRLFNKPEEARQYLAGNTEAAIWPGAKYWRGLLVLIIGLRVFLPFLIFFHPLLVFLLFNLLDFIDYTFFVKLGTKQKDYQMVDKALDLFSQFFIMLFGLSTPYAPFFLFLFSFRLFGSLLYFFTRKHIFFLVFPNLIEVLFLAHLLSLYLGGYFFPLLLILFLLKVLQEYFIHIQIYRLRTPLLVLELGKRNNFSRIEIIKSFSL
ncbi:MAG: hypothetical protein Q7S03_01000 [bacterium]|nr:hypothetical protein [bacterium]